MTEIKFVQGRNFFFGSLAKKESNC